jgi:AcrR family transcriptional regulator
MSTVHKPLRADAERNRRRILDAAAELFSERGLGVTLNDVAHHAGVGVATVYRRYPDKDVLIDALFDERVDELVQIIGARLADPDPWNGLVGALADLVELQEGDAGLTELLLSSRRGRGGIAGLRERIAPLLGQLIERGKAAGVVRGDIERQDLAVIQIMLSAVINCSRDIAPGLWRRYLEILLQGLRAEPSAPRELATPAPPPDQMRQVLQSWRPPQRG